MLDQKPPSVTLEELAHLLGGEPSVRPGPLISGARPLEFAAESDITYVASAEFLPRLGASAAGAVLVCRGLDPIDRPWIWVRNPEAAFARLTGLFYGYPPLADGLSSFADIHPTVVLGKDVQVGAFSVIGRDAVVGDRCRIGPHVVIGDDVRIGEDSIIFPHVTIYHGATIGRRVIVHAGTVIGADGFGFARDVDERGCPVAVKKYHSGTVEIGDDVEIGALCAVDRALAGVTRIGNGVKIDNLVQIAHNVHIGEGTVIAAQAGIAGTSSLGRYCMVGGQVGVKDHVTVGDGVVLATRVGIYRNVPEGAVMAGSVPAMPHKTFLRAQPLFKKLPEIMERLRRLERFMNKIDREEV